MKPKIFKGEEIVPKSVLEYVSFSQIDFTGGADPISVPETQEEQKLPNVNAEEGKEGEQSDDSQPSGVVQESQE